MKRERLGSSSDFGSTTRVFATPESLEVDEIDHFEVTRRRVFYDDVLLVTLHRRRGVSVILVLAIIGLFFSFIGTLIGVTASGEEAVIGAIVFGSIAAPILLFLAVYCAIGVDVVTVYGERTSARVKFFVRKKRARQVFEDICARARRAHRAQEAVAPPVTPPPEAAGG